MSKRYWLGVADRAVKSFGQGCILAVGADIAFNALSADWVTIGGFGAGGAALSMATSLAATGLGLTSSDDPQVIGKA